MVMIVCEAITALIIEFIEFIHLFLVPVRQDRLKNVLFGCDRYAHLGSGKLSKKILAE
jgi:hypothetical protein